LEGLAPTVRDAVGEALTVALWLPVDDGVPVEFAVGQGPPSLAQVLAYAMSKFSHDAWRVKAASTRPAFAAQLTADVDRTWLSIAASCKAILDCAPARCLVQVVYAAVEARSVVALTAALDAIQDLESGSFMPERRAPWVFQDANGGVCNVLAALTADLVHLWPKEYPITLLECAARLQDVGYVINYDQHHKHSYHLIRNSRLPGVRAHDLELIANVARYHRGAHPKRKHENLARIPAEDQQRVQRMAAILRLAGGLDRSRSQQVRDVLVAVDDDVVALEVIADQEPQVDIWGAERRTDLFEKAFGRQVIVRWKGAKRGAGGATRKNGGKRRRPGRGQAEPAG
jgi:hypothetical protein